MMLSLPLAPPSEETVDTFVRSLTERGAFGRDVETPFEDQNVIGVALPKMPRLNADLRRGCTYNLIVYLYPPQSDFPQRINFNALPILVVRGFIIFDANGFGRVRQGMWNLYNTPMKVEEKYINIYDYCDGLLTCGLHVKICRVEDPKQLSFVIDMLTGMRELQIDILNIPSALHDEDYIKNDVKKIARGIDNNAHVRVITNPSCIKYAFIRIPINGCSVADLECKVQEYCDSINNGQGVIVSERRYDIKAYINKSKKREPLSDRFIQSKIRALTPKSNTINIRSNISEESTLKEMASRRERHLCREELQAKEKIELKQQLEERIKCSRSVEKYVPFTASGPPHIRPKKTKSDKIIRDEQEKAFKISQANMHEVHLKEKEEKRLYEIQHRMEKIAIGELILLGR